MIVKAEKVCKRYASGYAVKDISIEFGAEKVAVLGYNGAGKSTLAKIIAGLIRPTSGRVEVLGKDPARSPEVRKRIGIATHNPMLYKELTVVENLLFYSKLYGVSSEIHTLAEKFGFIAKLDAKVSELSRGLIQRVAIARALLANPKVLIMDEATSGLDVEGREIVLDVLKHFDGCLIFTTHNLSEAEFCDRYVVLEMGEVKYVGNDYEKALEVLNVH